MRFVVVGVLLAGLQAAATAWAQEPDILNSGRRVVRAEPMQPDEHVVLDGILDEAVWKRAVSAGEFVQQDPVLGAEPTERTRDPIRLQPGSPSTWA